MRPTTKYSRSHGAAHGFEQAGVVEWCGRDLQRPCGVAEHSSVGCPRNAATCTSPHDDPLDGLHDLAFPPPKVEHPRSERLPATERQLDQELGRRSATAARRLPARFGRQTTRANNDCVHRELNAAADSGW